MEHSNCVNLNHAEHQENVGVICKEEFFRFCENTTIRGVPRIIKSHHRPLKYLWLIFFLLYVIGFTICFIMLLKQYLTYDVIHPPRILTNAKAPFPSFTVCNLRPLSRNINSILQTKRLKTPRQFATSVNNFAINRFIKRGANENYRRVSSVMGMGGYLESVPDKIYAELGHKREDFIINCQITLMQGSQPTSNQCENIGKWHRIVHPQYVNCYTFNLDEVTSQITNTMEIFLYLDEQTNHTDCIDCFSSDVKSQLSGGLILIHSQHTFPDFNKDIINLQPGTLTEIKLKIYHNINKLPPYGRCSTDTPNLPEVYGFNYKYSEELCKLITIQNDLNKMCLCNAIEYPSFNSSLEFCSQLPRYVGHETCNKEFNDTVCINQLEDVAQKINCKSNVSRKYYSDVVKSCSLPCSYFSYESDRSISSWPTKTWQLQWIQTRVASTLLHKSELKVYKEASTKQRNGQSEEAFDLVKNVRILEEKLLAVMINRPNYNVHLVEEKEVLSLTSFLSQAGGLFSIWIGLTLISIVEVVEMFVNCYWRIQKKEKVRRAEMKSNKLLGPPNLTLKNENCGEEDLV